MACVLNRYENFQACFFKKEQRNIYINIVPFFLGRSSNPKSSFFIISIDVQKK